MTVTALALIAAELTIQFRPAPSSPFGWLAIAATGVASVGLLAYYVVGPFTVPPTGAGAEQDE
jgi:hypothetical protein